MVFPSSSFYIISICILFLFFCTHCDTSPESGDSHRDGVSEGTLLGEFTYKKAVHTYFAFTTAKTKETVMTEAFWVT